MSDRTWPQNDEYYQDLLGVAAFGHLDPAEQAELDTWLAEHPEAQQELDELRAAVDLLPLGLEEMAPSPQLRDRLADAVGATEPSRPTEPEIGTRPANVTDISWYRTGAARFAALAAAVVIIALAAVVFALNRDDTKSENIDFSAAPEGVNATLAFNPDDQEFTFSVEEMPEPPEGHVYQLWLIAGDSPVSVGVMEGDEFDFEANRDDYDAFAITVEPAPDGSTGPTTEPIVVAPLHA